MIQVLNLKLLNYNLRVNLSESLLSKMFKPFKLGGKSVCRHNESNVSSEHQTENRAVVQYRTLAGLNITIHPLNH